MEVTYKPFFDPEFDSLIDRIYPPRVCIDNDAHQDCTLVKVDSTNEHGILLEMVQVLTDLDLVISKSYICSDGRWFMDVFHVTDQLGNKLTDKTLVYYIQQSICASRRGKTRAKPTSVAREIRPRHVLTEHTALEMTGTDHPGLLSEISAALAELQCHVSAAVAWTHNRRAACIIYVEDDSNPGPIMNPHRVARVQAHLQHVVNAHHANGERRSVRLAAPAARQTHTERRLHQLMMADKDYEESADDKQNESYRTIVTVENDMEYVVFHATVGSKGPVAFQEYYIQHKDGCMVNSETQRQAIIRCLSAAVERRASNGLRLDVRTRNRSGLLSDVTRVFREHGLSITRAEIGRRGERAVGSFHLTDASGRDVDQNTVEAVKREIEEFGGSVLMGNRSSYKSSQSSSRNSDTEEERPRFSLGTLFWSQLERLSSNFRL